MARGVNPEDKSALGDRHHRQPPVTSCQTKVVMGSPMPLEVHLAGVKMVGVRSAHPHPHLNPHLCASFLWRCGMVMGTGQGCGWECLAKLCTQAAME